MLHLNFVIDCLPHYKIIITITKMTIDVLCSQMYKIFLPAFRTAYNVAGWRLKNGCDSIILATSWLFIFTPIIGDYMARWPCLNFIEP